MGQVAEAWSPGGDLVELNDLGRFLALENEWNALVAEVDDQPFYRHDTLRLWLQYFAPEADLRVLVLRGADGCLDAVLPLLERRAPLYRVPLRQLVAPANPHSSRFDMLARDPAAAAQAFLAHLAADRSWDLLRLRDVPQQGAASALVAAAERLGMPCGRSVTRSAPYLPLPEDMDTLTRGLSRNLRKNLKRRWKRLEELGEITVQRVSAPEELDTALAEGLRLESSGWKGDRGTAILLDPATQGFYTDLARRAANEGRLSLYFLRLDGRAIAFQFGLEQGGRYYSLKPAYDESLRAYGPGQLLRHAVIRDCIERGLREYDMLGEAAPEKLAWTDHVRPHEWVYVFRGGAKGRVLRHAKFQLAPLVGRRLRRLRAQ